MRIYFKEKGRKMSRKRGSISIVTIADELGVSVASVSRTVNNRTGVSEPLRRRILEKLREYDFRTNYPAQRKARIAIVNSSPQFHTYHTMIMNGIFSFMLEHDITPCTLFYKKSGKENLLALLRDQQCSGAILMIPANFSAELPELAVSNLPIMLADETTDIPGIGYIDNDSYTGSLEAARLLLRLGHRRIAYIRSSFRSLNHQLRFNAYRDAMAEAGCGTSVIKEKQDIRLFLKKHPEITAVMTTNDEIAFHVIHAAYDLKIRIPEDLSVIGFDDYPFSSEICPPLTTIRRPLTEAGRMAAESISDFLASNGKTPLPRRILPTELVIRDTTAPCKKGKGKS